MDLDAFANYYERRLAAAEAVARAADAVDRSCRDKEILRDGYYGGGNPEYFIREGQYALDRALEKWRRVTRA